MRRGRSGVLARCWLTHELGADPYPFDGLSFDEFEHRVTCAAGWDLGDADLNVGEQALGREDVEATQLGADSRKRLFAHCRTLGRNDHIGPRERQAQ